MALRLVHTADWQIGKPMARFPADIAARLAAARLDAVDRLAALARDRGAGDVLVAGDVFDSAQAPDSLLRQVLARLAGYPNLCWHLLPGNHDPARHGGLWARLARLGPPAHVVLHVEAKAHALAAGAVLLPAPLTARETSHDPTAWMDSHATPEGSIRIGLAHGSVKGFGSLGEAPVPIDAGRRQSAGLAYFALGDWHGCKEIAGGVWYSGTPEPDSFADNGPGKALVVTIEGAGAAPRVEVVATAAHRWLERQLVMSRLADLEPVEAALASLGTERPRVLLALELAGALPVSEMAALEARLEALSGTLMWLGSKRQKLRTSLTGDELRRHFADQGLAEVATRLARHAEAATGGEAGTAARAVRLLLAMAATEGDAPADEAARRGAATAMEAAT